MNKKEVKRINKKAKRRKYGLSEAKVFIQTTERLRVLQSDGYK